MPLYFGIMIVTFELFFVSRRSLAPHLKSLMGPWWFSQFDPIPEVSQAARCSLEVSTIQFGCTVQLLDPFISALSSFSCPCILFGGKILYPSMKHIALRVIALNLSCFIKIRHNLTFFLWVSWRN